MKNNRYSEIWKKSLRNKTNLSKKQEKEIRELYKNVANHYSDKLSKVNPESLTYRNLKEYSRQLSKEYNKLGNQMNQRIKDNMETATQIAISPQLSFFNEVCEKSNIDKSFATVLCRIPKEPIKEIYNGKLYKDNKTLSNRIWGTVDKTDKDIQNIIAQGIAAKKSAYELAKDLEKYVDPDAKKDFEWSKVYPGSNKSVDYNAQRLARTAIQHAYQLSQKRSCAKNPFVDGIQWISPDIQGRTCNICRKRNLKIFKVNESPLDHPNGLCTTIPVITKSMEEIGSEVNAWIKGEKNRILDNWYQKYGREFAGGRSLKNIDKYVNRGIININRSMSNGLRTSPHHILTETEIQRVIEDANTLETPRKVLKFNEGMQTGFNEFDGVICIKGDILPDNSSNNTRDRMSQRAVLAHEYYGHFKSHPSPFRIGDWSDEFRASYKAALEAPNLSDEERRMLMIDAYDRAKEAGISIKYNKSARRLIYGYE